MSRKAACSLSPVCCTNNAESMSSSLYVPRLLCTSKQATRRPVTLLPFVFPNCKSCPPPSFPLYSSVPERRIWSHVKFSSSCLKIPQPLAKCRSAGSDLLQTSISTPSIVAGPILLRILPQYRQSLPYCLYPTCLPTSTVVSLP